MKSLYSENNSNGNRDAGTGSNGVKHSKEYSSIFQIISLLLEKKLITVSKEQPLLMLLVLKKQ